jgi:hypothetical protein
MTLIPRGKNGIVKLWRESTQPNIACQTGGRRISFLELQQTELISSGR